jgi:hypothetical protein
MKYNVLFVFFIFAGSDEADYGFLFLLLLLFLGGGRGSFCYVWSILSMIILGNYFVKSMNLCLIFFSICREVHEEANRAREKASEIKLRRQEQLAAHREKLKQAYLRKRLEQLKATSVGSGSEIKHTWCTHQLFSIIYKDGSSYGKAQAVGSRLKLYY